MLLQSCFFFANLNLSPFCRSCCRRRHRCVNSLIGSLSNDDGNENGKKAIVLDWSNSTLCIMLFLYISCRRCTTTTWKCQISCFVEDGKKRQQPSFSFPELWYIQSSRIQLKKGFAKIWRSKRDEISAIKFEAARIHFLSDVFVAVAVVVV